MKQVRPYSSYQDSGVTWFGELPSHWSAPRLMYLTQQSRPIMYGIVLPGPDVSEGVPIVKGGDVKPGRLEPGALSKTTYEIDAKNPRSRLEGGDLVYAIRGSIGDVEVVPEQLTGANLTQDAARVSPRAEIQERWLLYVLRSEPVFAQLEAGALGATIRGINIRDLKRVRVPLPPSEERAAIADFLDRETVKIDDLIDKKQRLIELLEEKRTALITQAVTKGLDPDVEMKDSGVEWLGAIPASWDGVRIRHVIRRIEQGWSPSCENREADADEWGVLKAGCVNYGVFNASDHKALPADQRPRRELEVRQGDVLMSRASGSPELIGSAALIRETRPRLLLSDKLYRLVPREEHVHAGYLVRALSSQPMRSQVRLSISGAGGLANNLAQSDVKDYWLASPPLAEQVEIAASLDDADQRLGRLKKCCLSAIRRLQEYRAALISAAVTGKIDVRESAA